MLPPPPRKEEATATTNEDMTASQISCLVRAAKEIESPLPSPVKAGKKVVADDPPVSSRASDQGSS